MQIATSESTDSANAEWGILVIHGVGETLPGQTLGAFIRTYKEVVGIEKESIPTVEYLSEESPTTRSDFATGFLSTSESSR